LLLAVGIVAALADTAMTDLTSSPIFASVRSEQYAASSATDEAIQSIRYTPLLAAGETLNASPPSYCWGNGPVSSVTVDSNTMSVWCSTQWNATSAVTRTVTFSTCLSSITSTACALNPFLQAVVEFDDYPAGVNSPNSAHCVSYCGTGDTITSWLWSPTVPTITALSVSSAQITGSSSPTTITGTGFVVGASTVNFVEESNGTPNSDNYIVSATPITTTTTSITVDPPAVTEGTKFYVTVSTPTGTSAYNDNTIFTYVAVVPTMTSITPNGGGSNGGIAVVIDGTGFYSSAQVNFTSGSVVEPATYVSVKSSTVLDAVAPSITSGTVYNVTVSTSAGTSTASIPFTYSQYVPLVSAISPTNGTTGTTLTITGAGFFSGASVYFGSNSNCGNSNASSSVTVNSSSLISAVIPSVTHGQTYCVTVQTSAGTSSNSVILSP
jgi:hypothetical protein